MADMKRQEQQRLQLLTQGSLVDLLIYVHGMTHREAARGAGISQSHLANLVSGIDPLSDETAEKLGKLLGCVPFRLTEMEERTKRKEKRNAEREKAKAAAAKSDG